MTFGKSCDYYLRPPSKYLQNYFDIYDITSAQRKNGALIILTSTVNAAVAVVAVSFC